MPTGLTYLIAEGKVTTTIDIVEAMLPGFGVDCRDGGKVRSLCEVEKSQRQQVEYAEKNLQDAIDILEELKSKSNQYLVDERIAINVERQRTLEAYHTSKEILLGRYRAAEAKLVAWEVPETLAMLKAGMLKHLREDFDYENINRSNEHADREIPHGFEIREELIEEYVRQIEYYRDKLEKAKVECEKVLAFYRDLHASLDQLRETAKKMPPA